MNYLIRALLLSIFLHALVLLIIVRVNGFIVPTNKLIVIDLCIEYLVESARGDLREGPPVPKRQKNMIRKKENIHEEIKPILDREETSQRREIPEKREIPEREEIPERKEIPTSATSTSISEIRVPVPAPVEQDLTSKNKDHGFIAQDMTDLFSAERGGIRTSATPESSSGSSGDASGGSDEEKRARYLKRHFSYIKDMIQKNLVYPRVARKMGWEGKVTVSFVVCENGCVEDIKIIETSGIWVFDKNAVDTIRRISPVPKPPVKAELIVPIAYKLQ